MLLEDPAAVVEGWAKYLKVGGKLIFDVPTYNAMIGGSVMNIVGQKLGIPMAYNRNNLDALEKVRPLLIGAGLDDSEMFVTDSYDGSVIDVKSAGEMFETIIGKKEWYEGVYAKFNEPGKREGVKELFYKEVEKLADKNGRLWKTGSSPWLLGRGHESQMLFYICLFEFIKEGNMRIGIG